MARFLRIALTFVGIVALFPIGALAWFSFTQSTLYLNMYGVHDSAGFVITFNDLDADGVRESSEPPLQVCASYRATALIPRKPWQRRTLVTTRTTRSLTSKASGRSSFREATAQGFTPLPFRPPGSSQPTRPPREPVLRNSASFKKGPSSRTASPLPPNSHPGRRRPLSLANLPSLSSFWARPLLGHGC